MFQEHQRRPPPGVCFVGRLKHHGTPLFTHDVLQWVQFHYDVCPQPGALLL